MAIQNGGKEGPFDECEVKGSRMGDPVFLIRCNSIKFCEFFKWFDWCQFYPSWQQQWGVMGLLIKSILGFFFNFSSSSRLIGRWECVYVILFLSLILPSLFYPLSLRHFCPCSLHGFAFIMFEG